LIDKPESSCRVPGGAIDLGSLHSLPVSEFA
jgi:hypothetical protein